MPPVRGDVIRRWVCRSARARPGRARLRESDGASHRGVGAERRLRRRGGPAARVRGARRRARVLLQRRRDADGPVPRVRRGNSPGRRAARGRISRRLRCRPGPRGGRPCTADARADRGGARALSHPLRHVRAPERGRVGGARRHRASRHLRGGRRALGAAPPRTATTRTACSCAPTASRRTSRSTRRTSVASTREASSGSSTCSAPTTTATSRASRHWPRCSATRGSPSRC